ncbi:MAG: GNAT family N-acetyltransferase [Thermoplasmata archaeon]
MKVIVRSVGEADIPEMVRIEKEITKSSKVGALERILHNYTNYGDPDLILAAEADDNFVGFLIGEIRPWEFGEDEEIAWIKVVGVDPKYQGRGIGKRLGEAFLRNLKAKGIRKVRTMVEWDSGDLITYFKTLGFDRSNFIALERTV